MALFFSGAFKTTPTFPCPKRPSLHLLMHMLRVHFGFSLEKGFTLQKHPRIGFYPSGSPTKPHHCLVIQLFSPMRLTARSSQATKPRSYIRDPSAKGQCKTAARTTGLSQVRENQALHMEVSQLFGVSIKQ